MEPELERYDRQIQIFGKSTQTKIFVSEMHVHGFSPAILEILKNGVLMGFKINLGLKNLDIERMTASLMEEVFENKVWSTFMGCHGRWGFWFWVLKMERIFGIFFIFCVVGRTGRWGVEIIIRFCIFGRFKRLCSGFSYFHGIF